MKKSFHFFSAALALVFLCSCSVIVKAPLTRFESPETRGKSAGLEMLAGYQGRTEVALTPSYTTQAPDMTNPIISDDPGHRLMGAAAFGLFENLDLGLSLPDARLGLKYQILGNGKESATKGNFPVAIVTGISKRTEDETESALFSSRTVSYKLQETQFDAGLVTGYRLQDSLLIYLGAHYLHDKLKTSYANPSTAPKIENSGKMQVYNLNAGLQKDIDKVLLRFEWSISETSLGRVKDTAITYGLAVGTYL